MGKSLLLAFLLVSGVLTAAEMAKKSAWGFTRKEHEAALAFCQVSYPGIDGHELKSCIKDRLGIPQNKKVSN